MLYTIGHSTHPVEEFIGLLEMHQVGELVDVRTVPRSRTNPQYNLDVFPAALSKHQIGHRHCKALGGLRHVKKDSINTAWRNRSFQGYADYMQTEEFSDAIDLLEEFAKQQSTVIMCAEAVWWRCHRSMIAEAMIVRGHEVQHIMPDGRLNEATLREFAVVDGNNITYPGTDRP